LTVTDEWQNLKEELKGINKMETKFWY
jgi:hypothetical protein